MIPDIDDTIGIKCYSTKFPGCGGKIRVSHDDFEVIEVISDKTISSIANTSGGYPVYSLTKQGIDTNHALSSIFKKTGQRLRSLGLKDANAKTTQFVYSTTKSSGIKEFESSKYSLKKLGFTKKPLSKKNMIANQFRVKITDNVSKFESFSEFDRILNFYGYQRFGSSRAVTHLIGKSLIQKNYRAAIDYLLSYTTKYDREENQRIRKELSDPSNYRKVYDHIPKQMDLERIVVSELIEHNDILRAIRALPIEIRRFFVQAYQSYLFNLTLSFAFEYGEDLSRSQDGDVCYDENGILGKHASGLIQSLAIPFVGYSYYKKTRFHYHISKILEEEEIAPRDFYVKEMQEISNEGGFRNSSISVKNFHTSDDGSVIFQLPRGSFATIVLREIMKPTEPLLSGF